MTHKDILAAEREAERFLEYVQQYRDRHATDDHFSRFCEIVGFRETAAVRRASMDLTRALSKMRKAND